MKRLLLGIAALSLFATGCAQNNTKKKENTQNTKEMNTIALTKADFLKKVVDYEKNPTEWKYLGDKPALVDFYATWCGTLQGSGAGSRRAGRRVQGPDLHLQDRHRCRAGTGCRLRHPLDPHAALHPHGGANRRWPRVLCPKPRSRRPSTKSCSTTSSKAMALMIDAELCPQNHRCPLIRLCPGRGHLAGGILASGDRPDTLHRMRQVHAPLRHAAIHKAAQNG